jgi:hypothetical protein
MRSLFRAFDAGRVRYLVISGQASVLYGGAFFTQDLDLWVKPMVENVRVLLIALARLRARVHKLTPPLSVRNLKRGHGFHFLVPQRGNPPLYLDIMGQPPRVSGFASAWRRRVRMPTPWGSLPVVSIHDLIELKKTNRPSDYEVISRLTMIQLQKERRPSVRLIRWALERVFRFEDLWSIVASHPDLVLRAHPPPAARLLLRIRTQEREPDLSDIAKTSALLLRFAERLQDQGRRYWHPRLDELRRLRAAGELLPEGTPVAALT